MTTPEASSTAESPALWNPNAAACWSVLFTPAFGAYLHARNAEALGRVDEAKANKAWFYLSLGYLGFIFVSDLFPAVPDAAYRVASISLLLGWYFSSAKTQIGYVREAYRDGYRRKAWTKPLLIGFGSFVGACIAIFLIALVQELARGPQ